MSESAPPPSSPPPGTPLNYQAMTQATGYTGPAPSKDECNMAMLAYILAIVTGFIGPLIIWLVKKEQSPFVNDQGKEVLNWSITVFLTGIVCGILTFLLMLILIGFIVGPLLFLALIVVHLIFTIMGALKAKDGIAYRYPFALRLLK